MFLVSKYQSFVYITQMNAQYRSLSKHSILSLTLLNELYEVYTECA